MKKFVAFLMVAALFISVLNVASSDSNFLVFDSGLSDFTTDPIFEKGLDNKEAQAALVVLVSQFMEEKVTNLVRNNSSTAYVMVSQGENAEGEQFTNVLIFYACSLGVYLCVTVLEEDTLFMESALEDKYSVIDSLDTSGCSYYTISPEALDEAQATLEGK